MSKQGSAIDQKTGERLDKIKNADILVGIPSYQSLKSIGRVVIACALGLAKYFPQKKSVILISEGGSVEKTEAVIKELNIENELDRAFISKPIFQTDILVSKYLGSSGKGTALKEIFEAAHILNVEACCTVDSDLRSITPEWIELLVAPIIIKKFGFVTPYYSRHKYDGTITNMIAYPLTRALYGRRVRQPIGGEFGFSSELVKSFLSKDVWETDIAKFGIDIWMTTVAIHEKFKICQSFLGVKIHDEKDPAKSLSPMFIQVVGTLFQLMEMYHNEWINIQGSRPTAIWGFESEFEPRPIKIDLDNLINTLKINTSRYQGLWKKILSSENYNKIIEIAELDDKYFELPLELWVKIIYEFVSAYHKRQEELRTIIEALIPIYFAMVASFVKKTRQLDTYQTEEIINHYCEIFEDLKPYLINLWTSNPYRFSDNKLHKAGRKNPGKSY